MSLFPRDRSPHDPDDEHGSLVEHLCADLVARWQRGERVPTEAYLHRHPELATDDDAAFELILSEIILRAEYGEAATFDEYLWRFPRFEDRLRRHFALHVALEDWKKDEGGRMKDEQDNTASGSSFILPPSSFPIIPGFELVGELGSGGMGVVYRARQISLNREVALKWLLVGGVGDEEQARFRTEAEALARLQHPNIVQIYDVGLHEGRPFLVFELVAGGNLANRLQKKPLPARAAAVLVETLATAMHYAHQRGIVHRDLKPANILLGHRLPTIGQVPDEGAGGPRTSRWLNAESSWLTADLRWPTAVKIADFGLAKLVYRARDAGGSAEMVGTPAYMAPEQASGDPRVVGVPADVYALGAILYEALTGRPPFVGESAMATLVQVTSEEPLPPSRLRPGLPPALETICLKCLAKVAAQRYATALALAEDLTCWRRGEPIQARPATRLERLWLWGRRHPLAAGLIVLGALAAALALAAPAVSDIFAIGK